MPRAATPAAQPCRGECTEASVHAHDSARAPQIQISLTEVLEEMGPLEVLPGSHRSQPATAATASQLPQPLPVGVGDAVVYDAALRHRGGANRSRQPRVYFYVSVMAPDGCCPVGLPFTIQPDEAACASLTSRGVDASPCADSKSQGIR